MGFISVVELKPYVAALVNRDENGEAKQLFCDGAIRCRISSQASKRAVRRAMKRFSELRTAHLEDLIAIIMEDLVEENVLTEDQANYLAPRICLVFSCKWENRGSKKDDDGSGRTIVATNALELETVINAIIEDYSDRWDTIDLSQPEPSEPSEESDAEDTKKKKKKKKAEINYDRELTVAKKSIKDFKISTEVAAMGQMVTDEKALRETVYGALQMTHWIGINEFRPENDYITASFSPDANKDKADSFYGGAIAKFEQSESQMARAQAIASTWVSSNVMAGAATMNMNLLGNNINRLLVAGSKKTILDSFDAETIQECSDITYDFIKAFATEDPSGKQTSMSAHPVPIILYMECIKDGAVEYPYYGNAIRATKDKGIAEQGIEKIFNFSQDNTFRYGDIHRYVMLSGPYKSYEKLFADNGVQVIHDLMELKSIIDTESERVMNR